MSDKTSFFWLRSSQVIGSSERLIYGDFMSPGADARVYDEVSNFQAMQRVMQQYLDDYNAPAGISGVAYPTWVFCVCGPMFRLFSRACWGTQEQIWCFVLGVPKC